MKKIVILGIGNIGFTIIKTLLSEHNNVQIIAIDRSLPSYFKEFLNKANNLNFIECDLTSADQIQHLLVKEELNDINVLISTVGILSKSVDFNNYKKEFDINFFGNVIPVKAFLKKIKDDQHNRIIILSSISGNIAPTDLHSYAPSKWALESFSNALRQEYEPKKIYVDIVRPTNIINKYSAVFDIKKGIDVEDVVKHINIKIQFALNERPKKGKSFFVPRHFLFYRIIDRVFPSLLNFYYKLKPEFLRKKTYKQIKKECVLITNGTTKLGKELALKYAKQSKKICLIGDNETSLLRIKNEINEIANCIVETYSINLNANEDFTSFIEKNSDIDLLINNDSAFVSKPVSEAAISQYQEMFDTNFFGQVRLIQSLLVEKEKLMKIININTVDAIFSKERFSAYAASKSAFWCYIKSIRRKFGNKSHILEVIVESMNSDYFTPEKTNEITLAICKAELKGKDRILIPKRLYFYMWLESLCRPLFNNIYLK